MVLGMSWTSTSALTDCQSLQPSALMSFEFCPGRAHQVASPALSQPLEIVFAHHAAVKDPYSPGTTVFALDGFQHLFERAHISPIAIKDFVGKRKTFRDYHQRQDELFAVSSVIARVAVLGSVDFLGFAFKIGARQIVEQHIKTGAKEIFPALSQMLFQGFLVLNHPIQCAIKPILFGHSLVNGGAKISRALGS